MPVQGSANSIARHSVDRQQPPLSNNGAQLGVELQSQERNVAWNGSQASAFRQQTPTPPAAFPPVVLQGKNTDDHTRDQLFLASHMSSQLTPEPGMYSSLSVPGGREGGQKRSIPFGFMLSAICVLTGGLMLIFIYFMSLGLRADSTVATNAGATSARTAIVHPAPSPTSIPMTPTPTYPGQSYADSVVTATAISTTTAQPITPSTSFKVRQKIYVTFNVHTNNHTGGICLLWYFNNKPFTTFAFPVSSSSSAYSYTYASVAGAGSVEIYWSDSASCSDPNKLLAQRATFTVTE